MPVRPFPQGQPGLPLFLQFKTVDSWLNRHSVPGLPTVTVTSSLTATVTDVPVTGDYSYSFTVDQDIAGWKVKVVNDATDPHTAGWLIEQGGAAGTDAPITGTLSWLELSRAGQAAAGAKIVKFFAKDFAGNWGDTPEPEPAAFPSLLRVSDGLIVDENNAPIGTLKGFNVHVAPTIGGEAFAWAQDHYTAMADAGARIQRLALHWDVFQKSAGLAGIDMTAVASLDTAIQRAENVGIYSLLELHLNVGRTPAWAQIPTGASEWTWFLNSGERIVQFLAERYGNTSSPQYTKAVVGFCPNEPPSANLEELASTFEVTVPWSRGSAPNWLIWIAPTAFGQGTPYPASGYRINPRRYLRLDTNGRGVVIAMRDYYVNDNSPFFGPYQNNGAIAPDYQSPGVFTASFGGVTAVYPNTTLSRTQHQQYMAPWVTFLTTGYGRFALAVEEFGAAFTGGEDPYIFDLVRSWHTEFGGPGTAVEMYWNYDVAARASNEFSARPGGVWRPNIVGWLSFPEPPLPISSLTQFDAVSRAQANDTTSHSAAGTSSWTHTPTSDTIQGVVVAVTQPLLAADQISGVTYGGQALTRYGSYASATARVYLYFLGTGIPPGDQTVAVTSTGTADKQSHCYSLTTGGNDATVDSVTGADLGTIANPALTVTHTNSLASFVSIGAHAYGGPLPPSQTAAAVRKPDIDLGFAHDPGADTAETVYRTGDPQGTTSPFGYDTLAIDTNLIGAIVVKELPGDLPIGAWENSVPDPSFEGSNAGGFWTPSGATLTFPTGVAGTDRTQALRFTSTVALPGLNSPNTIDIEAGWIYTFMVNWLEIPASRTVGISMDWKNQSFTGGLWGAAPRATRTTTGLAVLQARAPENASFVQLSFGVDVGGVIGDVYTVDQVLFAQGAYSGSYFDGTTTGAFWTGTPDNSSSVLPF